MTDNLQIMLKCIIFYKLLSAEYIYFKLMQVSASFSIAQVIKTNITSSLQVDIDRKYFAALTRQLSLVNSQWIYRLELYDYNKLEKINTALIYQTYNVNKHFFTFIPAPVDQVKIAVATINNIVYYEGRQLRQTASILHQQTNIYDVSASPDGIITVIVGENIVIFKNNNFKPIIFPQVIQNARFCDFSMDGKYMMIASTNSLNIYTYQNNNGDYNFQQIPLNSIAPVQYGSVTSATFNPTDSSQIIVGFLSSSPIAYSINNGIFFKKLNDIQPMSSQNAKIARFMPDGQRFFSFDYLNGIGLWPGSKEVVNNITTYKLYYQENMLLYDTATNLNGTKLIGYLWQTIKVVNINLSNCRLNANEQFCECPAGSSWNFPTYECMKLSCLQQEYATGVVIGNSCQCLQGYTFDFSLRKCVIDCKSRASTLNTRKSIYQCYCGNNWSWNSFDRKCQFNCNMIPYSVGTQRTSTECNCLPGFVWNSSINQCTCPLYMIPEGGTCICINNYYIDPFTSSCMVNCSLIDQAISINNGVSCLCSPGYFFNIKNNQPGCQLNCSSINNTMQENADFTSCICYEHMNWFNKTCVVDCNSIQYSDPSGEVNNTCNCAINYIWIDKIKECARNCTGVKHTQLNVDSTLRSCPCINNFLWSEGNARCQIKCGLALNSEDYSLAEIDKCECRPGFIWNTNSFTCQVDCKNIWNGIERINDTYCRCNLEQPFNSKTLTCGNPAAAGLFDSTLAIVAFAIGIAVGLVILVILIKFCWGFKTERPQGEKKMKSLDSEKKNKGKKLIRGVQKVNNGTTDQELRTNERLTSPRKRQ